MNTVLVTLGFFSLVAFVTVFVIALSSHVEKADAKANPFRGKSGQP